MPFRIVTAYFNIPHGHAVSLFLPHFLEFHSNIDPDTLNDDRGILFVKRRLNEIGHFFGAATENELKNELLNLLKNIGLEYSLAKLGLNYSDLQLVLNSAIKNKRLKNNPRKISVKDLKKILDNAYYYKNHVLNYALPFFKNLLYVK